MSDDDPDAWWRSAPTEQERQMRRRLGRRAVEAAQRIADEAPPMTPAVRDALLVIAKGAAIRQAAQRDDPAA